MRWRHLQERVWTEKNRKYYSHPVHIYRVGNQYAQVEYSDSRGWSWSTYTDNRHCGFGVRADSLGEAKTQAEEHINERFILA